MRELLDANVRKTVEALPFTSEGYNRAKSILEDKYGKESEIIKAYSRGLTPDKVGECWLRGPSWLSNQSKWPKQPEVSENPENVKEQAKTKHEKQLLAKEVEEEPNVTTETLLAKYASYWKLLRVTAFVKSGEGEGSLTTEEFQAAERFWITQAQFSQPLQSSQSS